MGGYETTATDRDFLLINQYTRRRRRGACGNWEAIPKVHRYQSTLLLRDVNENEDFSISYHISIIHRSSLTLLIARSHYGDGDSVGFLDFYPNRRPRGHSAGPKGIYDLHIGGGIGAYITSLQVSYNNIIECFIIAPTIFLASSYL